MTVNSQYPRLKIPGWLSIPSALLAFAYLAGRVFYDSKMSMWGFEPSQFPISIPDVYIQAFMAFVALTGRLMKWTNDTFPVWAVWISPLVIVMVAIAIAKISTFKRVKRWQQSWALSRAQPDDPPQGRKVVRRAATVFQWLFLTVYSVPLCLGFAITIILTIMVPMALAKAEVRDAWNRKAMKEWPVVSWTGTAGQIQSGSLNVCSDHWCAILVGGEAVVVQANQIKLISRGAPVARTTILDDGHPLK